MKTNDVVTLVAVTGAEYVGKLKEIGPHTYILGDPHIVTPTDGDSLGFMPTVAMTGEPRLDEVTFEKTGVLCVVPTASAVVSEYRKAVSGLII